MTGLHARPSVHQHRVKPRGVCGSHRRVEHAVQVSALSWVLLLELNDGGEEMSEKPCGFLGRNVLTGYLVALRPCLLLDPDFLK